jgi:drug/metabolite transporter (DMT)-like permease
MNAETAAIIFGTISALTWGCGDFCGGLTSRRVGLWSALTIAEISGLVLFIGLALAVAEPFVTFEIGLWSLAAGIAGTLGLGSLYYGLTNGATAIVAPVSAAIAAIIPAVYGALFEGLPESTKLLGFGCALVAIWFVAGGDLRGSRRGLLAALFAGLGFGAYYIFMDRAGSGGTFWPLALARGIALAITLPPTLWVLRKPEHAPWTATALGLGGLAGIMDASGNGFYLLATQSGRLDVAAMLSSIYPATTVLLARIVLHESISQRQLLGLAAALGAVVLIAW